MATPQRLRIGSSSWVLITLALALAAIVPAPAQISRTGVGEVIAVRELRLKPGVDVAQFEQFVTTKYNPAWEAAVPGMKGYIAKGDRGVRKDAYVLILIFDSEKTRNAIYPKAGAGAAERFGPFLQALFALNEQLDAFVEPGSLSAYTDYVVLR